MFHPDANVTLLIYVVELVVYVFVLLLSLEYATKRTLGYIKGPLMVVGTFFVAASPLYATSAFVIA